MAKGRDSGMPPLQEWEKFFDPEGILKALGCYDWPGDVIEFGCGFGTFTIAAARRASGIIYATDIDPLMVSATRDRAALAGLRNVDVTRRDFVSEGVGRPDASASYVMLFNILHIENPASLLHEASRVLCVGGLLGVIHWRHDIETPRGPPMAIRPTPARCREWAEAGGFRWVNSPNLPNSPWHWGMTLERAH